MFIFSLFAVSAAPVGAINHWCWHARRHRKKHLFNVPRSISCDC